MYSRLEAELMTPYAPRLSQSNGLKTMREQDADEEDLKSDDLATTYIGTDALSPGERVNDGFEYDPNEETLTLEQNGRNASIENLF